MGIAIQVDGKLRGTVDISERASAGAVRARVTNDRAFAALLAGRRIVKEIYVPGRIYSLVTEAGG